MEIPTSKAVKSPFVTYGLAIVAQIVALIARLSLTPFLGDKVPYATFFLATAASASFGGWGPGIVSTALGALFASLFIIPPFGSLLFSDHSDYLGLIIFLMVSGIISRLAGSLSKTEARERELQQLFKQTLFSIGDAVVSTDADKRVLLMNPVAENMTGWTQSEAQGKEIHEVFPIVREGADNSAEDPITRGPESGSGVGVSSHAELITRQGRRIPIEESWAPVRREDGSPSGVVFVFRDISERRRAEKTLDSALQKTGSILESITDAFASLDSQWRITFVNREAKRLNGLASDEMVGKSCWDLFPEAIGKRVQEECLKAQEERVSREFTTFLEKSQRWFDFKVYPVSDGGASIFYRDVTGHRHSEMTLRDSEERMRLLIDSAHGNAIIGLSDKGRIINWNVGAERLLLYTAAEILGQHAEVMFTPEDREKKAPEEELLTARTKGLARSERWHMRKDGTRFWGSGAVTPWLDDKGLLKGFVKVFQDRTQEWFAEQSVHASEKRFRAAIQANIALLWTNNSAGEMEGEQAGWGAFTGQTQDEYQGYGWAKAVHPDDAQPTIDGWHKAVAERNTFQFEHRVRRHDGECRVPDL